MTLADLFDQGNQFRPPTPPNEVALAVLSLILSVVLLSSSAQSGVFGNLKQIATMGLASLSLGVSVLFWTATFGVYT